MDGKPFEDVRPTEDGFTVPELKWRELLFIGAMFQEGEVYTRDPARAMPPFARGDILPVGARFSATPEDGRIRLRRLE